MPPTGTKPDEAPGEHIVTKKGSGPKSMALPSAAFRKKGANEVKLKAPDVPAVYVLYIEAGGIRETSPEHDFKVGP